MTDIEYMRRAIELAARGSYTTDPNPRVGCVIVRGGEIVGEGWHQWTGQAHAEAHALSAAGDRASGATAYVTLEPCAHHGRTPPCVDALIAAGIDRVVIATEDPFPAVAGRGIARLTKAGVAVSLGLLSDEARELNLGFLTRMTRHRPYVRLKLAQSADGRIALPDGRSQWISGPDARHDVHRWRARSSAILTGIGTVLADDPRLTVRLPGHPPMRDVVRIVLDRHARLQQSARLLAEPGPIIHATLAHKPSPLGGRVEPLALTDAHSSEQLARLMFALGQRALNDIWVEAGATLSGALLSSGLVDEIVLYIAPSIFGHASMPAFLVSAPQSPNAHHWRWIAVEQVGDDLRAVLRPAQL